jgi:succinate dehydrogenase / fumarate reductase flavoprotein subunit
MRPEWRKVNLVCALDGEQVTIAKHPLQPMRADLIALFDRNELTKYLTEEEMAALPPQAPAPAPARAVGAADSVGTAAATEETHS